MTKKHPNRKHRLIEESNFYRSKGNPPRTWHLSNESKQNQTNENWMKNETGRRKNFKVKLKYQEKETREQTMKRNN